MQRFNPIRLETETNPWIKRVILKNLVGRSLQDIGKTFDSCTGKVDSELTHGSNIDIPKIHVCKQTLDLSAEVPTVDMIELESLFGPLFDEYFNGVNQLVSKASAVTTTDASNKRQQQPDSTSSTSTIAIAVTANGDFDL
ncbi:hypothetical protein Tco_1544570 [Tanacetum coccineum]